MEASINPGTEPATARSKVKRGIKKPSQKPKSKTKTENPMAMNRRLKVWSHGTAIHLETVSIT
jgi:hypothetical protein